MNFRKKLIKNKHKKWVHPQSWLLVGDSNSTPVYLTERELQANQKKVTRNDSDRKYKTSNIEEQNFEELEQLESLRSEDTPHRLMVTHTIQIGSQVKPVLLRSHGQLTLKI